MLEPPILVEIGSMGPHSSPTTSYTHTLSLSPPLSSLLRFLGHLGPLSSAFGPLQAAFSRSEALPPLHGTSNIPVIFSTLQPFP